MQQHFLSSAQLMKRYGISEMTLYRWQKDEKLAFPRPMVVNKRKFFSEDEITAWERERAAKVPA